MTSNKRDDGGSAFPYVVTDESGRATYEACGMTLLDYFAAAALTGLVSRRDTTGAEDAEAAYNVAARMLAEKRRREKAGR